MHKLYVIRTCFQSILETEPSKKTNKPIKMWMGKINISPEKIYECLISM